MLDQINKLINKREDDVRCYRLPRDPKIEVLGQQYFSGDVMLFTDGVNRMLTQKDTPLNTLSDE